MNRTDRERINRRGRDVAKLIEKGKIPDNSFPIFEIDIPLHGSHRPDLAQRAVEENKAYYTTAYLEAIGATPSRSNAQLVVDHQPLEACDVFPVLKTAGWKMDALKVRPFSSFAKGGLAKRRAQAAKLLSSRDEGGPAAADAAAASAARKQPATLMYAGKDDREHVIGHIRSTLSAVKNKYLYPYNADAPGENSKHEESCSTSNRSQERSSLAINDGIVEEVAAVWQMVLQIRRPLRVMPKDISVAQKDFVLAFPFDNLASSMTGAEESGLRKQVLSLHMTRLIGLFAHYCYWRILRQESQSIEKDLMHFDLLPQHAEGKASGAADNSARDRDPYEEAEQISETEMEDLRTALLGSFSAIELPLKDSKSTVALHRPLILLALRVVTESILRSEFPLWFQFEDEQLNSDPTRGESPMPLTTAERIDSLVAALFDPNRIGSRIAPFESSLSAVHQSTKVQRFFEWAVKHRNPSASFLDSLRQRIVAEMNGRFTLPSGYADDVGGRRSASKPTPHVPYPRRVHTIAHTTSTSIRQLFDSPQSPRTRYMFSRARGVKAGGELCDIPGVNELRLSGGGERHSETAHPRRVHNQQQLYRLAMERLKHKYSQPQHSHQSDRLKLLASLEELTSSPPDSDSAYSNPYIIARKARSPGGPDDIPASSGDSIISEAQSSLASTRSAARLMFLKRGNKATMSSTLEQQRSAREHKVDELLRSLPTATVSRSPFLDPESEGDQE